MAPWSVGPVGREALVHASIRTLVGCLGAGCMRGLASRAERSDLTRGLSGGWTRRRSQEPAESLLGRSWALSGSGSAVRRGAACGSGRLSGSGRLRPESVGEEGLECRTVAPGDQQQDGELASHGDDGPLGAEALLQREAPTLQVAVALAAQQHVRALHEQASHLPVALLRDAAQTQGRARLMHARGQAEVSGHVARLGAQCIVQLRRSIYPRSVANIRLNNQRVNDAVMSKTLGFFFIYMTLFFFLSLTICFVEPGLAVAETGGAEYSRLDTAFSAAATCIGNVGPGLGQVGPSENFGWMAPHTKILLILAMLAGRLEFFTLIVLFLPVFWRR